MDYHAIAILIYKGMILFHISLQREIFGSQGYKDFVELTNFGLERLMRMKESKRLGISY
jgi:hypothetical protein